MILNALITLIDYIIRPFLWALPELEALPNGVNNAVDFAFNGLAGMHYFVPFTDTLLNAILLAFAFELTILTMWAFNKVISWLRGSG